MSEAKVQCPHVARQGLAIRRRISHFWDSRLVGAALLASLFRFVWERGHTTDSSCLLCTWLSACVAVRVC